MATKKEIMNILLEVLDSHLDEFLLESRFNRRKNSLVYTRNINEVIQELNIQLNVKPKYQPGVDAHIYPMIKLVIPRISEIALEMVAGKKIFLANTPEIILYQPMEMTAPKEYHVRWFASDKSEFISAILQINNYINIWAQKFLEDYSTVYGITNGYESNDERVMRQQHWYIYVAAAYILVNRKAEAQKIIEEKFGLPGLRKQFSFLFEYFND